MSSITCNDCGASFALSSSTAAVLSGRVLDELTSAALEFHKTQCPADVDADADVGLDILEPAHPPHCGCRSGPR